MMESEESVVFVRLVTGEDLITQMTKLDENKYTFSNPLKIIYSFDVNSPAKIQLGLIQWIFSEIIAEQTMEITAKDILAVAQPSHAMKSTYMASLKRIDVRSELISFMNEKEQDEFFMEDEEDQMELDDSDPMEEFMNKRKIDKKRLH
jgi:hypothetical protein